MTITFYNQTETSTEQAEKLIEMVFSKVETNEEMNIIFLSEIEIKAMNKQYRNIDKVTDVISFPDQDDLYIGDIFICIERAKEQAIAYGHSFEREIGFLSVHGYLHLKGYDHHTDIEEKLMIEKQNEILSKAGLERE